MVIWRHIIDLGYWYIVSVVFFLVLSRYIHISDDYSSEIAMCYQKSSLQCCRNTNLEAFGHKWWILLPIPTINKVCGVRSFQNIELYLVYKVILPCLTLSFPFSFKINTQHLRSKSSIQLFRPWNLVWNQFISTEFNSFLLTYHMIDVIKSSN